MPLADVMTEDAPARTRRRRKPEPPDEPTRLTPFVEFSGLYHLPEAGAWIIGCFWLLQRAQDLFRVNKNRWNRSRGVRTRIGSTEEIVRAACAVRDVPYTGVDGFVRTDHELSPCDSATWGVMEEPRDLYGKRKSKAKIKQLHERLLQFSDLDDPAEPPAHFPQRRTCLDESAPSVRRAKSRSVIEDKKDYTTLLQAAKKTSAVSVAMDLLEALGLPPDYIIPLFWAVRLIAPGDYQPGATLRIVTLEFARQFFGIECAINLRMSKSKAPEKQHLVIARPKRAETVDLSSVEGSTSRQSRGYGADTDTTFNDSENADDGELTAYDTWSPGMAEFLERSSAAQEDEEAEAEEFPKPPEDGAEPEALQYDLPSELRMQRLFTNERELKAAIREAFYDGVGVDPKTIELEPDSRRLKGEKARAARYNGAPGVPSISLMHPSSAETDPLNPYNNPNTRYILFETISAEVAAYYKSHREQIVKNAGEPKTAWHNVFVGKTGNGKYGTKEEHDVDPDAFRIFCWSNPAHRVAHKETREWFDQRECDDVADFRDWIDIYGLTPKWWVWFAPWRFRRERLNERADRTAIASRTCGSVPSLGCWNCGGHQTVYWDGVARIDRNGVCFCGKDQVEPPLQLDGCCPHGCEEVLTKDGKRVPAKKSKKRGQRAPALLRAWQFNEREYQSCPVCMWTRITTPEPVFFYCPWFGHKPSKFQRQLWSVDSLWTDEWRTYSQKPRDREEAKFWPAPIPQGEGRRREVSERFQRFYHVRTAIENTLVGKPSMLNSPYVQRGRPHPLTIRAAHLLDPWRKWPWDLYAPAFVLRNGADEYVKTGAKPVWGFDAGSWVTVGSDLVIDVMLKEEEWVVLSVTPRKETKRLRVHRGHCIMGERGEHVPVNIDASGMIGAAMLYGHQPHWDPAHPGKGGRPAGWRKELRLLASKLIPYWQTPYFGKLEDNFTFFYIIWKDFSFDGLRRKWISPLSAPNTTVKIPPPELYSEGKAFGLPPVFLTSRTVEICIPWCWDRPIPEHSLVPKWVPGLVEDFPNEAVKVYRYLLHKQQRELY